MISGQNYKAICEISLPAESNELLRTSEMQISKSNFQLFLSAIKHYIRYILATAVFVLT
ncbi:hypothetical protein OIU76_020990 [Salix suchowensis]|nr:hypothetical protein OIU76_020990 [Salix suchowensis]